MSFNRPAYLRRVLESLKAQVGCDIDRRAIVLFQDGAVNPYSNKRHASDQDINECMSVFMQIFPDQIVKLAPMNLGVALNFERAERFGFEAARSNAVIFLEDDLVLSRHYISILDSLIDSFAQDERVGYVAAYGDHRKSLEEQKENKNKLTLMTHNWGFGLYRRQWLKMRNHVLEYLDLIREIDYTERDRVKIERLFSKWGFGCPAISQDAAKTIACCIESAIKVNTFVCNAQYIGEHGLHMNPNLFIERGYARTTVYTEKINHFDPIDEQTYKAMLAEQRAWAGKPSILNPERSQIPSASKSTSVDRGLPAPDLAPPRDPNRQEVVIQSTVLITAAYRALLQRDPDPEGLAAYMRLFLDKPLPDAMRIALERLLTSLEFERRWSSTSRPKIAKSEVAAKRHEHKQARLVDDSRADLASPPFYVFVAGCGHTGTSLLAAMLGRHSKIYAIPYETSIFEKAADDSQVLSFFSAIQMPENREPTYICEKTPSHLHYIDRILELFPGCKIFLMIRDGRDVVASLVRRTGSFGLSVQRWLADTSITLRWEDHPNIQLIRYEELIQEPEQILRSACAFLHLDFEGEMLSFHKDTRNWFGEDRLKPPDGTGEEAHRALRNWQVHQPLFDGRGKWKKTLSSRDLAEFDFAASELMERLGYYDANKNSQSSSDAPSLS